MQRAVELLPRQSSRCFLSKIHRLYHLFSSFIIAVNPYSNTFRITNPALNQSNTFTTLLYTSSLTTLSRLCVSKDTPRPTVFDSPLTATAAGDRWPSRPRSEPFHSIPNTDGGATTQGVKT